MKNPSFEKAALKSTGTPPAMEFAISKVRIVGTGTPWKSGAPTLVIQNEAGDQFRIGAAAAVPFIRKQHSALLIETDSSYEFVAGIEFMFSSSGYNMTFSPVVAVQPAETPEQKAAREFREFQEAKAKGTV